MGLKYNPFTGSFDFTGVAPSTLGNYVLKAGDTMTGQLQIQTSSAQPNGALRVVQKVDDTNNGISLVNAAITASSRIYQNGTQFQVANNGFIFSLSNAGLFGLNTAVPTHTLTLPSTATGIALYNTSDQTTNYERGQIRWLTNELRIDTTLGGTGTARSISIVPASFLTLGDTGNTFIRVNNASATYKILLSPTTTSAVGINAVQVTPTFTGSSGVQYGVSLMPTINQSSTAGYTALLVNPTETATGSGAKYLIQAQLGGSDRFRVDAATGNIFTTGWLGSGGITPTATIDAIGSNTNRASLRIRSGTAPTSPNDGDIWYDGTDLKMRAGGTTKTFTLV